MRLSWLVLLTLVLFGAPVRAQSTTGGGAGGGGPGGGGGPLLTGSVSVTLDTPVQANGVIHWINVIGSFSGGVSTQALEPYEFGSAVSVYNNDELDAAGNKVVYINIPTLAASPYVVEIAPGGSASWQLSSTWTASTAVPGEYQAEAAMGVRRKGDRVWMTNIDWFVLDWSVVPD